MIVSLVSQNKAKRKTSPRLFTSLSLLLGARAWEMRNYARHSQGVRERAQVHKNRSLGCCFVMGPAHYFTLKALVMFAPVINFTRLMHAGEIWPLCRRLWRTDGSHYRHLYYPLHCVHSYLRASHEHRRVCKTSDRTTMLRSQRSELWNGFFSTLFMQNDVTLALLQQRFWSLNYIHVFSLGWPNLNTFRMGTHSLEQLL